jgi:hypothetical protein
MNLPASQCIELVERTAAALDMKALRTLFVSTQRNRMELCFSYAIEYIFLLWLRTKLKTESRHVLMMILSARAQLFNRVFAHGVTHQDLTDLAEDLTDWFPTSVVSTSIKHM